MFSFLKKLFGNKQDRDIKDILPIVDQINAVYGQLRSLSNDELRNKTNLFRQTIQDYLKGIDEDIKSVKQEALEIEDIYQKQKLYQEVDQLVKKEIK